jgi:hypothetical protein
MTKQLKADLKYCQQVNSLKSNKKIKKNNNLKTASQKDRKFIEALEQSLLAARVPLPTAVNAPNGASGGDGGSGEWSA